MNGYLEIRCCCRPDKLIGYLPDDGTPVGGRRTFAVGQLHLVMCAPDAERPKFNTIRLSVDQMNDELRGSRRAWKSDGHDLDMIRRIIGLLPPTSENREQYQSPMRLDAGLSYDLLSDAVKR